MEEKVKKSPWKTFFVIVFLFTTLLFGGGTAYFYTQNSELKSEVANQAIFLDSLQTNYIAQIEAADAKVQSITGSLITLKGYLIDASQNPIKLLPGDTLRNIRRCYIVKSPQDDIIFISSNDEEAAICETLIKILPPNSGFQVIDIVSEISTNRQKPKHTNLNNFFNIK